MAPPARAMTLRSQVLISGMTWATVYATSLYGMKGLVVVVTLLKPKEVTPPGGHCHARSSSALHVPLLKLLPTSGLQIRSWLLNLQDLSTRRLRLVFAKSRASKSHRCVACH